MAQKKKDQQRFQQKHKPKGGQKPKGDQKPKWGKGAAPKWKKDEGAAPKWGKGAAPKWKKDDGGPKWKVKLKPKPLKKIPEYPKANAKVINVYCDGGATYNGKAYASGGIGVYFGPNDDRNISEPYLEGVPTNQRTELYAMIRAL